MERRETILTRSVAYTAVFEPAEEGGYVVTFPAIPNLATQGETVEEARSMAEDCLRCYLESLQLEGLPFPESGLPKTEPLPRVPIADVVRVRLKTA